MSFTSPEFFLFLPIVLGLYWILPKRMRWGLLLIASWFFYGWFDARLLLLVLLTTITSYLCARAMEHCDTKKEKRTYLILTMLVCFGILFFFKYFNFAMGSIFGIARFFGANLTYTGVSILLPMGISFYVFQTMSYVLDVYRGSIKAESHLGYYALFVVFFPQLVAGPIERPGDLIPQLKKEHFICADDCSEGLRFLVMGFAKKVLIADYLAGFVDVAYGNVETTGGLALLLATFFFALQIYCDFSGYTLIALGCARLMGIRLTENFHKPYLATSVQDFWRRWHITLTTWFRDYLYIPLGGNRRGLMLQCRNILITFLVSGLWHGANLTFVVWGGIHGIYLVMERLWKGFFCKDSNHLAKESTQNLLFLKRLSTFLLVCFAWIFFRAASLEEALLIIKTMGSDWQIHACLSQLGASVLELMVAFLLIALLPKLDALPRLKQEKPMAFICYGTLLIAIFLCRFLVLSEHGTTAFLYFQF